LLLLPAYESATAAAARTCRGSGPCRNVAQAYVPCLAQLAAAAASIATTMAALLGTAIADDTRHW
jgi:hypothetical protein